MPFSLNKKVFTFNQSGTHYQCCLHLPKPWPFMYDFSVGGEHLQVIKRMLQNNSNDLNRQGIDGQKLRGSPVSPGTSRLSPDPRSPQDGRRRTSLPLLFNHTYIRTLRDMCVRAQHACEEQPPKGERHPRVNAVLCC